MLPLSNITWLHVEPTTKCNAHCPACARNNNGYGLFKDLVLESLTPERFLEVLNQLPNLRTVQMCGTFGDPVASEYIRELVDICVERQLAIRIHTNGSLKTVSWWAELADKLKVIDHAIIFGIDGLSGIHEIHRQGTNFNKILENAKSFIDGGGAAELQFLLFEHNKHQVKDCLRLSQTIGFKKFYTRNSIRIPSPARNYLTGEPYEILRVEEFKTREHMTDSEKTVDIADCMHLNIPSVYLTARGLLTPCCYIKNTSYDDANIDIPKNPSEYCRITCGTTKNSVS